jgi:long-chain fatty acid transport protein
VDTAAKLTRAIAMTQNRNSELRSWKGHGRLWFTVAAVVISGWLEARGVGFRLPNQDPEGISRGNAFAATADNPSAIYYNPAGITQLEGVQVRAGLYMISADTTFSGAAGEAQTDSALQAVPQFYATLTLTNLPFSFGLGIYAPYGLSLDWGEHSPLRTAAQKGSLLYASVNPILAWKVLPSLSIAAGPTLNYSQAKLQQGLTAFNTADYFTFKGDGFGAGFNAGVLWNPHQQWSFGVNYRSPTTIEYNGDSHTSPTTPFPPYFDSASTHGSVRFPQYVVGAISFRPSPDWNFEVDVDWTDWESVNKIVFHGTPFHAFNADPTLLLNYTSSFMYEFGATRRLGNGYFVNLGLIYSENSSPSKYFNPLIPDSNLWLPGIGFGRRGEKWDWAAGYHFAIGSRSIENNINSIVNGSYKTFNNAFNLAVTYKF